VNLVQYSGYSFPDPLPVIAEEVKPVFMSGVYDHKTIELELIGFLTGSDLSGLHLQKQQMISGLLNEYGDLTIQVSGYNATYAKALPISINFQESDLTTILPYTASFLVFSGESFSNFFGVSDPKNEWSFTEKENKIVEATHKISAQGEKVNNQSALQNAIDFVTGLTGFYAVAPMLTGSNAFLKSRSENINRKNANYSITEVYHFDGSDQKETESGIVTYNTTINFNKNGGLNASIEGSIYGGIDGELVNTGLFTPQNATDALINDVARSMSSYESGAFSFVRSGPTTYSYNINTGANNIDFSFTYMDLDNLDQVGNVAHKYKASIQADKTNSVFTVSAQGELYYNGIDSAINTGEYENSQRFQEIESVFSGVDPYLVAYRGFEDFKSGSSDFSTPVGSLGSGLRDKTVSKDPVNNKITYNYKYDTAIDESSGQLNNFKVTITDNVPLQLTNVVPTILGFAAQATTTRTLGEYTVSATADENSGQFPVLKNVVSGMTSGYYNISESETITKENLSYNLSRFY
jgi:hypothetical protein